METYLLIAALVGAAAALIFALIQRSHVMKASEGNEKMVKIAQAIRSGAPLGQSVPKDALKPDEEEVSE